MGGISGREGPEVAMVHNWTGVHQTAGRGQPPSRRARRDGRGAPRGAGGLLLGGRRLGRSRVTAIELCLLGIVDLGSGIEI